MKITKTQYELFKKECKYWMNRFQLNDYDLFFEWKKLKSSDATSYILGSYGDITIALNIEMNFFDKSPNEYIKELAKHEVIHCLLGRFSNLASERYIGENELNNEEEHLVRKLVNIIK